MLNIKYASKKLLLSSLSLGLLIAAPALAAPATPILPVVAAVNSTTQLQLNWTSGAADSGSMWVLRYSTDGGTIISQAIVSPTSTKNFLFTGLAANTRYYLAVASSDGITTSAYTTSSPIYTATDIPSNVSLNSQATPEQTTLSWTGNASAYFITNQSNGNASGWISDTFFTDTFLICNTTYTYLVKARNGDAIETDYATSINGRTQSCQSLYSPPLVSATPVTEPDTASTLTPITVTTTPILPIITTPLTNTVIVTPLQIATTTPNLVPTSNQTPIIVSAITHNAPAHASIKRGKYLVFKYAFKNTSNKKIKVMVKRELIASNGRSVFAISGNHTVLSQASFHITAKQSFSNRLAPGIYQEKITIFQNKTVIDSTSFTVEVK